MNSSPAADGALVGQLLRSAGSFGAASAVVCPPFIAIPAVAEMVAGSPIAVGAQNVHWEEKGAFTGEISPSMLRNYSVTYAIVGHSERRALFGETDAAVARRFWAAVGASIVPILCVGESGEERNLGVQNAIVESQLRAVLRAGEAGSPGKFAVAYEPIWAIGTGKSASAADAQAMHRHLRSVVEDVFGEGIAKRTPLLYGGSVSRHGAADLFAEKDIDGALVGGASLVAGEFLAIISAAAN
jgi:triosephosphate isomerase